MEVKSGYKLTDVGVIPDEWEVTKIGTAGQVLGGRQRSPHNTGELCKYLRVANVFDGYVDTSDVLEMPFTTKEKERFLLRDGDILLNEGQSLELVGRSAIYRGEPSDCCFQNTLVRFRANEGTIPEFAQVVFQRYLVTGVFASIASQTTSIAHLGSGRFANLPFPVPPLPEQRAIAAALGDVDALLASLDQSIVKKRDLKQAAMQQLLTGQTRLPGFAGQRIKMKQSEVGVIPEDWEAKAVRDITVKVQDGTHFSPALGGNDYLYVTSKNIGLGRLDIASADRISTAEHEKIYARCDVKKGDLLLTKDGANTGNAALNHLDEPFSLLSSVAFLRFDPRRHHAAFFLYQVLSGQGQQRIQQQMSGNAITRLTLAKIKALRFPTTSLEEQAAIAEVLSDMDSEIAALEARRDKTKLLKEGMMQELLTGRTRLV